MMNIGEFAQLTGLSVKALRIYEEQGLLRPASVDPSSGYRRYSAAQLSIAIRVKALRAAGVSVADAARVLGDAGGPESILAEHRDRLTAERQRQDAALASADALLGDQRWTIEERESAAQPWAGVVLPEPDPEVSEEEATTAANAVFAQLWKALTNDDNPPTGAFWSCVRQTGDSGDIEVLCCWPIARPLPAGWSIDGHTVESGEVSAGPELVVRWRHEDEVPTVDGATHPAVIALLAEAEGRGVDVDVSRMRQVGVLEDGESVGMEVRIPVR